jgi:two-component system sensor histidine kinase KdpD
MLFEKFFRGDHPGVTGAGLGLSICRGILDAHQGALDAMNRMGGGASFRFSLPVLPPPPALPAMEEAGRNEEAP